MAGRKPSFRKYLSKPGLLKEVRRCFDAISDEVNGRRYNLADSLMSGLTSFSLTLPSLIQFDREARGEGPFRSNLRSLFGIEDIPSDSCCFSECTERSGRFCPGLHRSRIAVDKD